MYIAIPFIEAKCKFVGVRVKQFLKNYHFNQKNYNHIEILFDTFSGRPLSVLSFMIILIFLVFVLTPQISFFVIISHSFCRLFNYNLNVILPCTLKSTHKYIHRYKYSHILVYKHTRLYNAHTPHPHYIRFSNSVIFCLLYQIIRDCCPSYKIFSNNG